MESVENHDEAATRRSPCPSPSVGAALPTALTQLHGGGSAGERALGANQGADRRAGGAVPPGDVHHHRRGDTSGDGEAAGARPHRGQERLLLVPEPAAPEAEPQKQQRFDYFGRQFRHPQPLPMLHRPPGHPFSPVQLQAPPAPNTPACNREAMDMQQPCYMIGPSAQAAANAAYYSQMQPSIMYPRPETMSHGNVQTQAPPDKYYQAEALNNTNTQQPCVLEFPPAVGSYGAPDTYYCRPVTLNLFPQYPTFANREKTRRACARPSTSGSFSWEAESPEILNGDASMAFYDFFGEGH